MIIPDYNKGAVNVHLKLSDKDASLPNEALAAKAFMCMTGLKPVDKITETSWQDVEYQVFQTESLRMYVACDRIDITDWFTINSSILVKDKTSNDIIVTFESVSVGRVTNEKDIIPMIDFLFKYKKEVFTSKSDVIL